MVVFVLLLQIGILLYNYLHVNEYCILDLPQRSCQLLRFCQTNLKEVNVLPVVFNYLLNRIAMPLCQILLKCYLVII